jgi:hypothetical protein
MNGYNMKQATAAARRHGYLRTWWRDSRATGKRFFLRLGCGRQQPGGFELYWLLSAGVHRVVKCSVFDYSMTILSARIRQCSTPWLSNWLSVGLRVRPPFAGATCSPSPTRSH